MSSPVNERRELEAQIARAWDEYQRATAQRQTAERELSLAKRQHANVVIMRPQGRATDREVELAEQHQQDAQELYQQHFQRANAAFDAAKELGLRRDDLLRAHPADFAEEAEQATQAAVRALTGLRDAMGAAWEAWETAERAWLPVCKVHGLRGVPPCPLPKPDALLDVMPRPPQVAVMG